MSSKIESPPNVKWGGDREWGRSEVVVRLKMKKIKKNKIE